MKLTREGTSVGELIRYKTARTDKVFRWYVAVTSYFMTVDEKLAIAERIHRALELLEGREQPVKSSDGKAAVSPGLRFWRIGDERHPQPSVGQRCLLFSKHSGQACVAEFDPKAKLPTGEPWFTGWAPLHKGFHE